MAEFSEVLIAHLVGGTLARSRVQKDWDVSVESNPPQLIQVKYVANTSGEAWVNEHQVRVTPVMTGYAIVVYEAFMPVAAILLATRRLGDVGKALKKRHPALETSLQLTRANYRRLVGEPDVFRPLGVRVWTAPEWKEA